MTRAQLETLKYGTQVEITLGSSKTKDLRTVRGMFLRMTYRPIPGTMCAYAEALVQTAEGEVRGHRVKLARLVTVGNVGINWAR